MDDDEEESLEEDEADRLINSMEDRIDEHIIAIPSPAGKTRKRVQVIYAAYDDDADGNPIDNLNEVPIHGPIKIISRPDSTWGVRKFKSPVLESPTWLDLCVQADNMIRRTRDTHHVFLEGINVLREEDGIKICTFAMGS